MAARSGRNIRDTQSVPSAKRLSGPSTLRKLAKSAPAHRTSAMSAGPGRNGNPPSRRSGPENRPHLAEQSVHLRVSPDADAEERAHLNLAEPANQHAALAQLAQPLLGGKFRRAHEKEIGLAWGPQQTAGRPLPP